MFWPHHMSGFGWGGWIAGGLVMLLFLGAFVVMVYFLIRAGIHNQSGTQNSGRNDALQILKQRYARGEITKAEYKEIRQDLET